MLEDRNRNMSYLKIDKDTKDKITSYLSAGPTSWSGPYMTRTVMDSTGEERLEVWRVPIVHTVQLNYDDLPD